MRGAGRGARALGLCPECGSPLWQKEAALRGRLGVWWGLGLAVRLLEGREGGLYLWQDGLVYGEDRARWLCCREAVEVCDRVDDTEAAMGFEEGPERAEAGIQGGPVGGVGLGGLGERQSFGWENAADDTVPGIRASVEGSGGAPIAAIAKAEILRKNAAQVIDLL